MTSTLISYSRKVTRAALAQLPTPSATPTHIPIPHIEVVEALIGTLRLRHIGVVGEEFAVSSDGMEMFGILDLETTFDGCRFAVGIRNANSVPDLSSYIIMMAIVPTYNQANPNLWTPTGQQTVQLASVGMHVVGSTAGHPEMVGVTREEQC